MVNDKLLIINFSHWLLLKSGVSLQSEYVKRKVFNEKTIPDTNFYIQLAFLLKGFFTIFCFNAQL
jgi:hypothetical protein